MVRRVLAYFDLCGGFCSPVVYCDLANNNKSRLLNSETFIVNVLRQLYVKYNINNVFIWNIFCRVNSIRDMYLYEIFCILIEKTHS